MFDRQYILIISFYRIWKLIIWLVYLFYLPLETKFVVENCPIWTKEVSICNLTYFFFVEIETRSCETVHMSKFIKFQKSKKMFDIYRIYLMKNIFSLHLKYSEEIWFVYQYAEYCH